MKGLCLLLVFVSLGSYAQVRENIKVKHQSQTRGQYAPETFEVEEPVASEKEETKVKAIQSNKGKKQDSKSRR